ncbi:MAG: hypothetical protein NVS9B10_17260 [Nevskia sp.]
MRFVALLIAFALCGLAFQPAQADSPFGGRHGGSSLRLDAPYLPPGRENREDQPRRDLSPGEAAQRAQQINGGGRVLSVEQAGDGYRVKLLRDGEVRVVFVQ